MEEASKRIEEHESAEDALGQSDLRFRRIFEYSNDAILVIDPARDEILDANSTACDMLGNLQPVPLSAPAVGRRRLRIKEPSRASRNCRPIEASR